MLFAFGVHEILVDFQMFYSNWDIMVTQVMKTYLSANIYAVE